MFNNKLKLLGDNEIISRLNHFIASTHIITDIIIIIIHTKYNAHPIMSGRKHFVRQLRFFIYYYIYVSETIKSLFLNTAYRQENDFLVTIIYYTYMIII